MLSLPPAGARLVLAAVLVSIAAPALAAQGAGRVFQPRAGAANPNLVAFERIDGGRREIEILDVSSNRTTPLRRTAAAAPTTGLVLPDVAGGSSLTGYSGDVDWRPTAESRQYWLAYVASGESGLQLYLQSVDAQGKVGDWAPLEVPNGTGARSPRWSPDGKHLLFVAQRGELMIVPNVFRALADRDARQLRPVRLGQVAVALAPAWAPKGGLIAYQVDRGANSEQRFGIEVLAIDPGTMTAILPALAVAERSTDNLYRPSWSHDDQYLAFYTDRAGAGGAGSEVMDVAIAAVQYDPRTTRPFRTELLQGQSRKIASAVIPNAGRGPSWTRLQRSNMAVDPAVTFVQRDDARDNPIVTASVPAWVARGDRAQFELVVSNGWGTRNHKDPIVVEVDTSARYLFVAAEAGGERVQWRDVPAPWRRIVEPTPVERSRWMLVLPGVTQLKAGRKSVGVPLVVAGAVGATLGTVAVIRHSAKGTATREAPMFYTGAAVGGLALALGILEDNRHSSGAARARLEFGPRVDGRGVLRAGLGARFEFGRGAR